MKNVLFINVPHIGFNDFISPQRNAKVVTKKDGISYGNVLTDMPLGILSLSSYIKKFATDAPRIDLLDFNCELSGADAFPFTSYREFFLDVLKRTDIRPDIVGISALFSTSYAALIELASAVREMWPDCMLLAGGPVPSGSYKEIFRDSQDFDALCYGEGERPFLGLINSEDPIRFIAEHDSWISREKLAEARCFQHQVVDELDDIPFYDYDLVNPEKYGLNPALTAYHGVNSKDYNFHYITSLGCPFKCTFCASHKVHGRSMRYWSIDRVKSDLIRLKEKFGAKTIVVQDDHFMGDYERALKIVNIIGELELKAVFQNGLAMYALKREFLEALKAAGVEQLLLSIESGNENTLKKLMRKPLKLNIVERVVADCRDLGIYTNANILIGMPGETIEDIEITRRFLKTIDPNWFMIFCASPLVGSEMFETAMEKGYLVEGFVGTGDFKRAVLSTPDFSADFIQQVTYFINLEINFVHNSDMRLGNYALALRGIENAIRARSDHALAYHYGAICHEKMGAFDMAAWYQKKANEIVAQSAFWKDIFDRFSITLMDKVVETENTDDVDLSLPYPVTNSNSLSLKNIFGYQTQ